MWLLSLVITYIILNSPLLVEPRPLEHISLNDLPLFTLNGSIPYVEFYIDDTENGEKTHYKYSDDSIDRMVSYASKKLALFKSRILEKKLNFSLLDKKDIVYASAALYSDRFYDKKIAILGSSEPWCECIAISLGAKEIVTIDYNYLSYGDKNNSKYNVIKTVSSEYFDEFYRNSTNYFDIILSISSFDHSGLGRYGDPLDPDGDIKAIKSIHSILKPDGLLILTVPIGSDLLVFNLLRRYGAIRLPLLLDGWDVIDRLGWQSKKLNEDTNFRKSYEPVFILQKSRSFTKSDDELR